MVSSCMCILMCKMILWRVMLSVVVCQAVATLDQKDSELSLRFVTLEPIELHF